MTIGDQADQSRITTELPPHLADWQLPPGWQWGAEGVPSEYRHSQEVIDAPVDLPVNLEELAHEHESSPRS